MDSKNRRTIAIFGSTSGLGWCLAGCTFLEGNNVCIFGRRNERLRGLRTILCKTAEDNNRLFSFEGDVTKQQNIDVFLDKALKRYYRLDCVVNCCAVYLSVGVDHKQSEWEKVFDVNFWGNFRILKSSLQRHQKNNKMSFVTITSSLAKGGVQQGGPYACSKAALNSFITTAAKEIAPSKLTILAAEPMPFKSEMNPMARAHAKTAAFQLSRLIQKIDETHHGKIVRLGETNST